MEKILLAIADNAIAPRFDLTTEVLITTVQDHKETRAPRAMLLPGPSADELCGLILKEDIKILICGGIEEEHYQFLSWKKVKVIDRVIGDARDALQELLTGGLRNGAVLNK